MNDDNVPIIVMFAAMFSPSQEISIIISPEEEEEDEAEDEKVSVETGVGVEAENEAIVFDSERMN